MKIKGNKQNYTSSSLLFLILAGIPTDNFSCYIKTQQVFFISCVERGEVEKENKRGLQIKK